MKPAPDEPEVMGEYDAAAWPSIRVVVTGGRDFIDAFCVRRVLNAVHLTRQIGALAHGGASGADALAARWAEDHDVPCTAYPADWKGLGRKAGPVRNTHMLTHFKPDGVVAFPGNAGTKNCRAQAAAMGIPRLVVRPHPEIRGGWRLDGALP